MPLTAFGSVAVILSTEKDSVPDDDVGSNNSNVEQTLLYVMCYTSLQYYSRDKEV